MITELNQPPDFEPIMAAPPPPPHPPFNRLIGPAVIDNSFLVAPAESSTITSIDFADPSVKSLSPRTHFEDCSSSTNNNDLKAIPGKAMFSPTQYDSCSPREAKRPRTDYYAANTNTNISTNTNTSVNSSNSNSISSLQPIPQLPAESQFSNMVVREMAARQTVTTAALLFTLALFFDLTCSMYEWQSARATYYAASDPRDSVGGACGYGDLSKSGFGLATVGLSEALFERGQICGACFEVRCVEDMRWCIPGTSIILTATNFCAPNYGFTNCTCYIDTFG